MGVNFLNMNLECLNLIRSDQYLRLIRIAPHMLRPEGVAKSLKVPWSLRLDY